MKKEAQHIKSNLKNRSCGGYTYEGKEFRPFLWHSNDCYELYYQKEGTGKTLIGDYYNDLKPGEFYLIAPKLPHSFNSHVYLHNPVKYSVIFIEEIIFDSIELIFPEFANIAENLKKIAERGVLIKDENDELLDLLNNFLSAKQSERIPYLLQILLSIEKKKNNKILTSKTYKSCSNSKSENRIDKICNYIEKKYLSNISNDVLAKKMNMSRSTLQRFFKKSTGMTISDYINDLRVGHASHLLTNTNKSISEIVYESGFNTVSNFNRIFQKVKKCTPSEIKNSLK